MSEQPNKKSFSVLEQLKFIYTNHTYIFSFILLLVIMLFINHSYLSFTSLTTLLMQSTIKGILALGMTFVIISGMIDLSIGSNIAITAGLAIVLLNKSGSIVSMLIFCVAFSVFLSAIIGLFVTKGRIAPFVVTLATMSIFRSIIVQLGQGGPFNVDSSILPRFRIIAAGSIMKFPNMAIVLIVLTAIMIVIASETKFGRYVYAIGSNETAARLTGINVNRVKVQIFMLNGALIGVTSFLFASRMTSVTAANAGMSYEMDAIAAAIIGGTSFSGGRGRILGTFFGALSLQLIENLLVAAKIPPFLTGLVKGTIILVAILLQSKKESKKA